MYLNEKLRANVVEKLKSGGVIAFVTDTVWGIGCLPDSENAVKKIYEIKKREVKKPLILMSNDIENLQPYVKEITPKSKELIDEYLPGALTLVMKKSEKTPEYVTPLDTVGIRIPANEVFRELCEIVPGKVLVTTSANLSDEPSAKNYEQAVRSIGKKVDLVLDDFDVQAEGLESTVILIEEDKIKILRQGALSIDENMI